MSYARAVARGQGWWQRQPKPVKAGVIAAGLYAGYKIYQLFNQDKSGGTSDDIEVNENKLSYPIGTYKVYADEIEAAIWGTGAFPSMTEDDEAIGLILMDMNTADDVYQLATEYGVRTRGVLLEDGGNLVETIQTYLDSDIKATVNADYRAKNIPFQWQ